MCKIIKGQFTCYDLSDMDVYFNEWEQEEKNIVDKIFKDVNKSNKDEVFSVTNDALNLPINEQLHFIYGVLSTMYTLSGKDIINKNIESFLAQKVFNKHRKVIMAIHEGDEPNLKKITKLENELNVKIVILE